MTCRNPFRDRTMRTQYESLVQAYRDRRSILFTKNGERHRGNSWATEFWRGFDGIGADKWDRPSRKMIAYACFCAGRDVRACEDGR